VCFDPGSARFIASFIPRLGGGVLNEDGILSLGEFGSAEEARHALMDKYGKPDAWLNGHPEALHMRAHKPDLL
jgi:hypothetical protein